MEYRKSSLLGVAAGLMSGLMMTPAPITARRASTHLTWDASSCPAGTYNITSTATNVANSQTYVSTMSNVSLPRTALSQDFVNLPSGNYTVIARVSSTGGDSFESQPQSVAAQDDGKSAPAPAFTASATGRHRPSDAPVLGIAQPRETPPPPIGYGAGTRRADVVAFAPDPAPQVAAMAAARAQVLGSVLRMLAAGDATGALIEGDSLKVIDADGDGIVDVVGVTIAGKVWLVAIRR